MTKMEIDQALAPPFRPFLLTSGDLALVIRNPQDFSISGEALEIKRADGARFNVPFAAIGSIDCVVL